MGLFVYEPLVLHPQQRKLLGRTLVALTPQAKPQALRIFPHQARCLYSF